MVAPGMGCDEQNGLPVSMGKMQRQPVWQGLLTPQLPPQVAEPFASLRNCRAETVSAQRTPMTSAVKNIELIFFMIAFLLVRCSRTERSSNRTMAGYFAGLAATNRHVPILSPEEMKHVQEVLLQGTFLVQVLLQTVTVEA
jgi:hypothetical protein